MKILVIGQAPSKNATTNIPWQKGISAKRLWGWFGVKNRKELLGIADLINAVPWCEGSNKKGDRVPTDKTILRDLKKRLIKKIEKKKYKKIIFVGKFAEKMMRNYAEENDIKFVRLFHPSGANISCNGQDSNMKRKVARFLRNR